MLLAVILLVLVCLLGWAADVGKRALASYRQRHIDAGIAIADEWERKHRS